MSSTSTNTKESAAVAKTAQAPCEQIGVSLYAKSRNLSVSRINYLLSRDRELPGVVGRKRVNVTPGSKGFWLLDVSAEYYHSKVAPLGKVTT